MTSHIQSEGLFLIPFASFVNYLLRPKNLIYNIGHSTMPIVKRLKSKHFRECFDLGSISPKLYVQLLHAQIPKVKKRLMFFFKVYLLIAT